MSIPSDAPDISPQEIEERIATACRILGNLDLTHAALGHVSYRLPERDAILIKGKGRDEVGLRYTLPADIITVDFSANKLAGAEGLQPPSESYLHLWVYRTNPAAQCVIHVHPEAAVLLTICEKEILPIYGSYGSGVRLAIEGIPTYRRSVTISDDVLGKEFAEVMGQKPVALMKGHGITVSGPGIEEAVLTALAFNQLASMTCKAYLLGTPTRIPDEDIEAFSRPPEQDRPRGSKGGRPGVLATWRYYERLAGGLPPEA